MPTSAAGNKAFAAFTALLPVSVRQPGRPALGFTLIELLVVLALIAIGTAAVSLSFRDSSQTALEREAHRLAALLESARARSRASGMPVQWRAQGEGFVFDGLPPNTLPSQWLSSGIQVVPWPPSGNALPALMLGPDPIIGAQSIQLRHFVNDSVTQGVSPSVWLSTDGLKPFAVSPSSP
ncbi:MAG: prepilin-type N-terminal cleavage/methylation domain-containing protein [Burkholderiales bacterium]|jgi:general secretion pathway protein H|nr:prepilin-type N-terminal cleavage/methylation domain-containing protein [Burkholderiales bacterium]